MDITPILNYISDHLLIIVTISLLLEAATLILLLMLAIRCLGQGRRLASLLKTKNGVSLENMISGFLAQAEQAGQERTALMRQLQSLRTELGQAVQNIGFVRYNAFPGVSGEMSFSLALLDAHRSGFVLTSIFGREEARVYAKEIKDGQAACPLSAEELTVVRQAENESGKGGV